MAKIDELLQHISTAADDNNLLKITLGNKREKNADIKNIFIKPLLIKDELMLSFVYRYQAKDITKNYSVPEGVNTVKVLLQTDFFNADLYSTSHTFYFSSDVTGKQKLVIKAEAKNIEPSLKHDKEKHRLLDRNAVYLKQLGITSAEGKVKKEMQHKYRQINRYIEIIDSIIKDAGLKQDISVVDMGSGKGYLTFALYDHLQAQHMNADISGIELREDLVDKCNAIAVAAKYKNLHFKKGSIQETPLTDVDMLIALHACDTATDDAIAKGIKADAKIIICAPCCHKQIRKQMAPANALKNITQHGILLERQAEMVTDTIRALMLEAHGYRTKVFEFIEEEDTPKNVLIVGIKNTPSEALLKENTDKIKALKEMFGIKEHYLETIVD